MTTQEAILALRDEGARCLRQAEHLSRMLERQDPEAPGTAVLRSTLSMRRARLEHNVAACYILIRHLCSPNRVAH